MPSTDDAIVFPVRLVRVERVLLLRELIDQGPAAVMLLLDGATGVTGASSASDWALIAAELVLSAGIIALLAKRVRHLRAALRGHHVPHATPEPPINVATWSPDWLGVAAAVLLAADAAHERYTTGHLPRPEVLSAILTLILALGGQRLLDVISARRFASRRPRLALTMEGVTYRGSRRKTFAAAWSDVSHVSHDENGVRFTLRDGQTFALLRLDHIDGHALIAKVRDALPQVLPERLRS